MVFQDFRLLDHLSARDNIALPLRIVGVPESDIRDHIGELADWLAIGHRVEARPQALSISERQRVAIARAIVSRPDLLVADEPTGRVDGETALMLVRVFERLNSLGTTVLIASPDLALARQFECRHLHLEAGELTSPDPGAMQ
jgi:cell division transport system ATP-binding protein